MNEESIVIIDFDDLTIESYDVFLKFMKENFPDARISDLNDMRSIDEEIISNK